MEALHPQHRRTKHQKFRFPPYHQLTYTRTQWAAGLEKFRRFEAEAEARAFLSALQRRRSKGGRVIAKLEHRDRAGIWHTLPLEGGCS